MHVRLSLTCVINNTHNELYSFHSNASLSSATKLISFTSFCLIRGRLRAPHRAARNNLCNICKYIYIYVYIYIYYITIHACIYV